jgi:hypothetical protein
MSNKIFIAKVRSFFEHALYCGSKALLGSRSPHCWVFTITFRRTTLGRNPLDEGLALLKLSAYTMFCWPCIRVYQYNETNMMHFSFNLLRIKGLYMFRALLGHLQEALHKRHLVYCVRVMSVGCCCYQGWNGTEWKVHHVGFIILISLYILTQTSLFERG